MSENGWLENAQFDHFKVGCSKREDNLLEVGG